MNAELILRYFVFSLPFRRLVQCNVCVYSFCNANGNNEAIQQNSVVHVHSKSQLSMFFFPLLRHQRAQLGENHYEPVDPVEAAKLLGTPDSSTARPVMKKKEDEYESPSANCEYAMVNKANKKVSG